VNAAELTAMIVAAAAAAAGAVRLLDKLIELVQARRYGPDYNFQIDAWRREILEAIREGNNITHQLRIELRECTHRVLSALGVSPERHQLPDDPRGFEEDQGGQ